MLIPADNYISEEDFRRLCGYTTTRTIRRMIEDGRLDAFNLGTAERPLYIIRKYAIIKQKKRGRKRKENG